MTNEIVPYLCTLQPNIKWSSSVLLVILSRVLVLVVLVLEDLRGVLLLQRHKRCSSYFVNECTHLGGAQHINLQKALLSIIIVKF
jgi:hypothetical protein